MLPGRGGGLWLAQPLSSDKAIANGTILNGCMVYPFACWTGFLAFFFLDLAVPLVATALSSLAGSITAGAA
jgi:hypothetical protein